MLQLDAIADQAHQHFRSKNTAREESLALSREALRSSANAVRAVHRADFERARELLAAASEGLQRATAALANQPDVLYAGYVQDAQKEYAEATATYAIVRDEPLVGPEQLGVSWQAYLNGLGEAAGELRRYILDELRRGTVARGEELLQAMNEIYELLVTIDYPDAMTGGLRRTTDMVRGVLERTRGDLTMALRQQELSQRLAELERRSGGIQPDDIGRIQQE
ncbi:MAG: haloacid dehalogenase [Chloroflexi bacterium]|nr:haloacid dehalogenase [Chloroflexota bacterium]